MKPMLAQNWKDENAKFPLLISPKLDGIRLLARYDDEFCWMKTRSGKFLTGLEHIKKELRQIPEFKNVTLDGELYIHNVPFQHLSGIIRRKKNFSDRITEVKYYIYDIANGRDPTTEEFFQNMPYVERHAHLVEILGRYSELTSLVMHQSQVAVNRVSMDAMVSSFLAEGYEGAMARPMGNEDFYQSESYRHAKRSKFLMKIKQFDDAEFTLIGVEEEFSLTGEAKGRTGKFVFKTPQGKEFRASGITDEVKADSWIHPEKYIGKLCTVKYFGLSEDGIPRHPNFVRFRDYE